MEHTSYGAIFKDIFVNIKLKHEMDFKDSDKFELENDVGSILDLLATLLEY